MVRTYIKKKHKEEIVEKHMKKAIHEITKKNSKLRATAKKYSLNPSTLFYRIQRLKEYAESKDKATGPYSRRIFTPEEEAVLSRHFVVYSKLNYGLSYPQMRMLAFVYAKTLNRDIPENWEKGKMAGKDWLNNFLSRIKNLSIVKTKNKRTFSVNLLDINFFCSNYQRVLSEHNLGASRIFNLLEVEVQLDVPAQNDEHVEPLSLMVTICAVASAAGDVVPPVFVFPLDEMDNSLLRYTPPRSLGLANSPNSKAMAAKHFLQMLAHIQRQTKSSKKDPIVLLLDNRNSHCTLDVTAFCQDNGISMVSFPPHWAKNKQPVESSVMGPFKKIFSVNKEKYQTYGRTLLHDLTALISVSYTEAFTRKNIITGFEKCHIWPFSKNSLQESNIDVECLDTDLSSIDENKPAEEGQKISGKRKKNQQLEPDILRIVKAEHRSSIPPDEFGISPKTAKCTTGTEYSLMVERITNLLDADDEFVLVICEK